MRNYYRAVSPEGNVDAYFCIIRDAHEQTEYRMRPGESEWTYLPGTGIWEMLFWGDPYTDLVTFADTGAPHEPPSRAATTASRALGATVRRYYSAVNHDGVVETYFCIIDDAQEHSEFRLKPGEDRWTYLPGWHVHELMFWGDPRYDLVTFADTGASHEPPSRARVAAIR